MPDLRAAFLEAIGARPDEDAPRLIYADWLDENGNEADRARALFIRTQCAADPLPAGPQRDALLEQADALLLEQERDWLGPWYDRLVRWEFRRGFVHGATLSARTFLRYGEELFRTEPVFRLGFVDDEGDPLSAEAVPELVAAPAFGQVGSLDILGAAPVVSSFGMWHWSWREPPIPVGAWLRALAGASHVTRLRAFLPGGIISLAEGVAHGLDPGVVEAFCGALHLRTLTHLDLSGCSIGARPARDRLPEAIASATFAPNLRRLSLADCRLTDQGVARLGTQPALANLRRLDVTGNRVSRGCLQELLGSPNLGKLRDVSVEDNQLPTLSRSPLAGRLRGLTVLGMEDARSRAAQQAWLQLISAGARPTRLHLICHDPTPEVFGALPSARWLRRVRDLTVQNDSQSDGCFRTGSVWLLLRAGALPALTRLRCHEFATPKFVAALARWPGLGNLEQLILTDDYYGRLVPALFTSPHLRARLRSLRGVRIEKDEDAELLVAAGARLTGVRDMKMSFIREISLGVAERLFRSAPLRQVESLWLGFEMDRGCPNLRRRVYQLLADPAVLPRLRSLVLLSSSNQAELQALRRRLGPRLKV